MYYVMFFLSSNINKNNYKFMVEHCFDKLNILIKNTLAILLARSIIRPEDHMLNVYI